MSELSKCPTCGAVCKTGIRVPGGHEWHPVSGEALGHALLGANEELERLRGDLPVRILRKIFTASAIWFGAGLLIGLMVAWGLK